MQLRSRKSAKSSSASSSAATGTRPQNRKSQKIFAGNLPSSKTITITWVPDWTNLIFGLSSNRALVASVLLGPPNIKPDDPNVKYRIDINLVSISRAEAEHTNKNPNPKETVIRVSERAMIFQSEYKNNNNQDIKGIMTTKDGKTICVNPTYANGIVESKLNISPELNAQSVVIRVYTEEEDPNALKYSAEGLSGDNTGYFKVVIGRQYYINLTFAKESPIAHFVHTQGWKPQIFLSYKNDHNIIVYRSFTNFVTNWAMGVEVPCDYIELQRAHAAYPAYAQKKLETKASIDTQETAATANHYEQIIKTLSSMTLSTPLLTASSTMATQPSDDKKAETKKSTAKKNKKRTQTKIHHNTDSTKNTTLVETNNDEKINTLKLKIATLENELQTSLSHIKRHIELISQDQSIPHAKKYCSKHKSTHEKIYIAILDHYLKVDNKYTIQPSPQSFDEYEKAKSHIEQDITKLADIQSTLDHVIDQIKQHKSKNQTTKPHPTDNINTKIINNNSKQSDKKSTQILTRSEKLAEKRRLKKEQKKAKDVKDVKDVKDTKSQPVKPTTQVKTTQHNTQSNPDTIQISTKLSSAAISPSKPSTHFNIQFDSKSTTLTTHSQQHLSQQSLFPPKSSASASSSNATAQVASPSASTATKTKTQTSSLRSESRDQKIALNNVFKHLVELKIALVHFEKEIKNQPSSSGNYANLFISMRHYVLLLHITRIAEELKRYKLLGGSGDFDQNQLVDLRNMIMHGAWEATQESVLKTAHTLADHIPDQILDIRKDYLTERVLSEKQQKILIDEFKLSDNSGLYLLRNTPLLISDTDLYKKLAQYHDNRVSNNLDAKYINQIVFQTILPNIKTLFNIVNKNGKPTSKESLLYYQYHFDALKMLIAMFGELTHHFSEHNKILFSDVLKASQMIRNKVGHDYNNLAINYIIFFSKSITKIDNQLPTLITDAKEITSVPISVELQQTTAQQTSPTSVAISQLLFSTPTTPNTVAETYDRIPTADTAASGSHLGAQASCLK